MKIISIALFSLLLSALNAQASIISSVNMNFQSGAQFTGNITFADGYTSVLAVDGTLTGYQFGSNGYIGSGSDHINWIWSNGYDFAPEANIYSTFLMDGVLNASYTNFISFTYDINNLSFVANAGYGNKVDYTDAMVSGSIGAVPEPEILSLFGLGLLGIMFARKRNIA